MIIKLTYIVRLSWTWTSIQFAVAGRWPEGFSGHVQPLWWSCRHTCRRPSRRVGCPTWVRRGCPPHRPYPRRCGTERWLVLPLPRNFSSNLLFFSAQCAFFTSSPSWTKEDLWTLLRRVGLWASPQTQPALSLSKRRLKLLLAHFFTGSNDWRHLHSN